MEYENRFLRMLLGERASEAASTGSVAAARMRALKAAASTVDAPAPVEPVPPPARPAKAAADAPVPRQAPPGATPSTPPASARKPVAPIPEDKMTQQPNVAEQRVSTPEASAEVPVSMSVLSPTMRMKGEIDSDEDFTVHGHYEGKLRCRHLIISPGASVSGEVVAQFARVSGTISGNIQAANMLLFKGGMVRGDLKCRSLGIQPGCTVKATVDCDHTEVIETPVGEPVRASQSTAQPIPAMQDADFSQSSFLKLVR